MWRKLFFEHSKFLICQIPNFSQCKKKLVHRFISLALNQQGTLFSLFPVFSTVCSPYGTVHIFFIWFAFIACFRRFCQQVIFFFGYRRLDGTIVYQIMNSFFSLFSIGCWTLPRERFAHITLFHFHFASMYLFFVWYFV